MTEYLLILAGLIFLLAFDFLLVAARASFFQTSHGRLLALREQMEGKVNRTSLLLSVLPRVRASLNFTLLLVRFFLAGLVLYYVTRQTLIDPMLASVIALLIAGFLGFWFEWAIERSVSQSTETWAIRLTPFVHGLMTVVSPLLVLPLSLSRDGQGIPEPVITVTEDELKTLVDAGEEEGLFEQGERRMIYSIFQLGDTLVREIMVPRIDMLALDVTTSMAEAADALLRSGHSRVPVFEETVDNTLGLLYAKDLLRVWREGDRSAALRDLLRPAFFVPEAKKADELMAEMQRQRVHMAIVVDEYGGVAGLVTLEDVVEEILGDIRDEYDQAEELPYQVLKDGDYLFQGRVDLDDFNEIMQTNLPREEADTIGGLIYSRVGRVPDVGDTVETGNLLLKVEQVSGRRIRKVRAHRFTTGQENEEEKYGVNE